MGESVAEGTVVRWIKKVGDAVDRDEPLFEISTDKVDAEIPSPAAGTLVEVRVREGETVPVDSVVALIAKAGEAVEAAAPVQEAAPEPAQPDATALAAAPTTGEAEATAEEGDGRDRRRSCGESPRITAWTCPRSRARASAVV